MVKYKLGKKSESQMEFEPTTLRDLVDHGGSWVQIPSGTQIFSEFVFLHEFEFNKSVRREIIFSYWE